MGDDLRAERGIESDSPAATRKIAGLCRALRAVGIRATIVSMGRGQGGAAGARHRARAGRIDGVPVLYGPIYNRRLLSPLLSMFWLARMASRLSRDTGIVHLFYNQFTLYLPALLLLRAGDKKVALDIEDGPVSKSEVRHTTRYGNASPALYARLVNGGALLACSALAEGTAIRPVIPYYGTIEPQPRRKAGDARPVEILFSGYMDEDTGVALLADAIARLRAMDEPALAGLRISVAGMGPGLAALSALESGSAPEVRVLGRLSLEEYRAALTRAAAGLSLKLARGPFAQSTFPSKTVEYAEYGLAVIATDISDVRAVLGDTAFYVENDDAAALAAHLLAAARDPAGLARRGRAAQTRLLEQMTPAAAGERLAAFLFEGEAA